MEAGWCRVALVEVKIDSCGVAEVILNRPRKKNAFSAAMIMELAEMAQNIGSQASVRLISLTARGDMFCAGADLEWMRHQLESSPSEREKEAWLLAAMLKAWYDIPVPIVAKVQGGALGGGLGLMTLCDEVVACESAKFSFSEVKLGLIPATISPYVHRAIGSKAASRYLLSGEFFNADDARGIGLLDQTCSAEKLDETHASAVSKYRHGAPSAVRQTKALFRQYGFQVTDDIIERSVQSLIHAWNGTEAREGISSFFAKDQPRWVNKIC